MSEILIRALDNSQPDYTKDAAESYKAGMFVDEKPDGHVWSGNEQWPNFALIKIPGLPVGNPKIRKYFESQIIDFPAVEPYVQRLRRWSFRWADLPAQVKTLFAQQGYITIKVGMYSGPYDYTWDQVRGFLRNHETGLDETEELA